MEKIAVIMTVKNEEKFIEKTLLHLQNQSIKPNQVVIVDDRSTDNTPEILQEFGKKNGWIIKRKVEGEVKTSSIVESLTLASSLLKNDFDYLMVLDGDIFLEVKYIEKLIQKFESIPALGIAGGHLGLPNLNKYKMGFVSIDWNVWGSNRIYSKKCWMELNQMQKMSTKTPNWDTEHSARAKARGFTVKRFDDIFSEAGKPGTSFRRRSFYVGVRNYEFGRSFSNVLIQSLLGLNPSRIAGYIAAWANGTEKIDNVENMDKLKLINDIRFLKSVNRFFKF